MVELIIAAHAPYPSAGTLRVHPVPEHLLRPEPEHPGLNRFDDPEGIVGVRYTATRLIGCLRETLARFRRSSTAEATLEAVNGIDDGDVEWDLVDPAPIADWLATQRVGTIRVTSIGPFIDIEHETVLVELDKHPRVREAVRGIDPSGHLDVALIRLGGGIGRPISQAVGIGVREWIPQALGLGYRSRLATDEPCWALWDTTAVETTSVELDPGDPQHREAVRSIASFYELPLPATWL